MVVEIERKSSIERTTTELDDTWISLCMGGAPIPTIRCDTQSEM